MSIVLPKEKGGIDKQFCKAKFLMMGQSKIGKSEFWAQDPKALFLEAEPGLNYIECFKIPIRSWEDLIEVHTQLVQLIAGGKEFPYSVIVIDTIDRVVDLAEENVIAHAKEFYKKIADRIESIGEVPEGGGWARVNNKVMNMLNKFNEFPCAIALVGHLAIKRIEEGTRKYDKSTISLWKGMGRSVLAWVDHIMHLQSSMVGDELRRTVYSIPTQSREAGSRGGMIPDGWQWKEDMSVNYKNFRGLFT